MGSLEWVAAPRAVFLVTEEAGTARRLFLPLKNNLAPDRLGYAFEIENKTIAGGIATSSILWSDEPVTISADAALAAAAKKRSPGAIGFLQQVLGDGPVDQTEIVRLGKEAGFTEKNLRSAREEWGVKSIKKGFGAEGKWVWVPPGGATLLKLVVNKEANGPPSSPECAVGIGDKTASGSDPAQDAGTELAPDNPESGPEKPNEGDDVA